MKMARKPRLVTIIESDLTSIIIYNTATIEKKQRERLHNQMMFNDVVNSLREMIYYEFHKIYYSVQ